MIAATADSRADALERYEPSGRVAARFVPLAIACLAAAAGIGIAYQRLLDVSPYVVLHVVVPLALGAVLGVLTIGCVCVGHVRNKRVVGLLAVAVAGSGIAGAWWIHGADTVVESDSLRKLRPVIWFFEALFIALLAIWIPRTWWRRAVFCEERGRFVRRELFGKAWGCELLRLRRVAGESGLDAITDLGLRPVPGNADEAEFRFWLRRAASATWMTIWWHGKLESPRGRRVRRDVLVLRRVLVDEDFLDKLRPQLARSPSTAT